MKFGSKGLKNFEQDSEMEAETGIEVEAYGMTFICRRMGGANVAYKKALGKHSTGVVKRRQRTGELDLVASEAAANQAFLDACLIGWSGVVDEQGAEIPYSRQAAQELFGQYPELLETITDEATLAYNFRRQEIEAAADALGNS